MHLPSLIKDLALILLVSGAVSILFRYLRQPVVLGYLLAGLLVGPQVTGFPTIGDQQNIQVWAELGVIFLLFVLGLEFSFRKLFEVGRSAIVAAVVEVAFMMALGFGFGKIFGWDNISAIFLGGVLAISSTTIIIKAFEEQGVKTKNFAELVFGILIVEDLLAVVILAFLSTFGSKQELQSFFRILVLLGSLAIFIPIGIWFFPRLLRKIHLQFNDETRIIVCIGLCLGLVLISSLAGFSPALGAFLAGAFLGETIEGERVERLLRPIRDLFGAIFFTSVGMLVDLKEISNHWPIVLLIAAVTVGGKIISTAGGALLGRQDKKTAFQAGLSLGQIGEFSFIIATLGLQMGVVRSELYSIAVAVSLLTTFVTPYLIRLATGDFLKKIRGYPQLWESHLATIDIHPNFNSLGVPLEQLKIRDRFGAVIVALIRGDRKILAPSAEDSLMPYDRITVFGTDEQLGELENYLKTERREESSNSEEYLFGLEKLILHSSSKVVGKTLPASGIRESVSGIILGIERMSEKLLNPPPTTILEGGDILWIYGEREKIRHWATSQDRPL